MISKSAYMALIMAAMSVCSLVWPAKADNFMARDHIVVDLQHNIDWLRCTVGQVWDGDSCAGETVRLDHEQIEMAITQADEQLGKGWRLPTVDELEGLLCESCKTCDLCNYPMIDAEMFPRTEAEPYWTGDQNSLSRRNYFSVNFINGWVYGRFFPTQQLAVRLVRDRR